MTFTTRLITLLSTLLSPILSPLFAWQYDRLPEPPSLLQKRRELMETLPPGCAVLEIGAGTGASVTAGAYDAPPPRFARVVLSEPDPGMRTRMARKLRNRPSCAPNVHVMEASLPRLPFDQGEFDAVVAFFAVSHMDGRPAAMKEVARVLKPGGRFVFLDHGVHGHGHGEGEGEGGKLPFFLEWLAFWRHGGGHADFDVDQLLGEVRGETTLDEVFVNRMSVDGGFFDEVVYGCFERKAQAGAQ